VYKAVESTLGFCTLSIVTTQNHSNNKPEIGEHTILCGFRMPVFSTHFKSDGIFISFYIQQKIILSGIHEKFRHFI
ncbi:hypothetical protein, partial [Acinetobacter baumannii]|uniref:hypothetical protein n=1 Tax=Acinetobacter baumannii TaxID=470 RepID=UPI001BC87C7E